MNASEVIAWILANPTCYLATLEGNQPRVRCMSLDFASAGHLWFHMPASKAVFAQVSQHELVEACFIDIPGGIQIRIRGRLERDLSELTMFKFLAKHPELSAWITQNGNEAMGLFKMCNPVADVTTRMGREEFPL